MSDSKKPDESKKDAATSEEKGELSAEELEKVAGGVLNLGTVGNLGSAQVKLVPAVQVGFDPNTIPKGGTSE